MVHHALKSRLQHKNRSMQRDVKHRLRNPEEIPKDGALVLDDDYDFLEQDDDNDDDENNVSYR
jgi:hypothetical protein